MALELVCDEVLEAEINAAFLERAVVNLMGNALKYSPDGGRGRVVADRTDEEVRIQVIDRGIGIPASHLPRIFERFYRVDKSRSRKEGGTGLGLAIVKHIVQAHGGRVVARSVPGEGSVFAVFLPGERKERSPRIVESTDPPD